MSKAFTLRFLGTGTSGGIPEILCECAVCRSEDPRDRRLRTSALIEANGRNLLIDTSVDLRQQFLRESITDIDAVLYTHAHADHILGLDDLRRISLVHGKSIPLHAHPAHFATLEKCFHYIFEPPKQIGGGILKARHEPIEYGKAFEWNGLEILPLRVRHGMIDVSAFRFDKRFAYVTDASAIPEETEAELKNLDGLVLNALRFKEHTTHFNLEQALAVVERLKPKQAWFVHMTHDVSHQTVSATLPPNVFLAHDGLRVSFG
ncbi:MAG: MBL fold metallo-hydrolase [Spirochaetia bacterium]|nr:MBL fold metallo-hydrolase [Spirochaetia bacterium]